MCTHCARIHRYLEAQIPLALTRAHTPIPTHPHTHARAHTHTCHPSAAFLDQGKHASASYLKTKRCNSALLQNIRAYNQAHAAGDEAAMVRLREAMRAPVAMLHRVGLFEMLVTAREIVDGAGPRNEGRRVFGGLVLEYEEALGRAEADGGGSG